MRVTVDESGSPVSYFKGAPEVLLNRCSLSDAERTDWAGRAERGAHEGYRLLALARGKGEDSSGFLQSRRTRLHRLRSA